MQDEPGRDAKVELGSAFHTEPILTANLYADGELDRAVSEDLALFWRIVLRQRPELRGSLWFLRDNTGGEHLKIQVHGPASHASFVSEILEATVAERGHSSRLVWATFDRHPAVFDLGALAGDERAVALFLRCLCAATQLVLESFRSDGSNLYSHRQNVLIRVLCSGLPGSFRTTEERRAYHAYHRDWIVRFLVLWSGYGLSKANEVLAIYRAQTRQLAPEALDSLSRLMDGASLETENLQARVDELRNESASLSTHLTTHGATHHPDPFTAGTLRPILFKLFHVVANQLGIAKIDEGFVHQLLLEASGGGADGEFVLAPLFVGAPEDPSKAFTPKVAAFEEDYAWVVYVLAGCTEDGWRELFHGTGEAISSSCGRALALLRRGDVESGKELLDEIAEQQRRLAKICSSMAEALGRFHFGTLAYYFYLRGDMTAAVELLDRAAACIARAISHQRFLLPMAPLVTDIPLQKARVARRLSDWKAMEEHLRELRDYQEDRRPLCILDNGELITYSTLVAYFRSQDLTGVEDPHRAAIDALLDPGLRRAEFRRRYAEIYAPRFKLTPYP